MRFPTIAVLLLTATGLIAVPAAAQDDLGARADALISVLSGHDPIAETNHIGTAAQESIALAQAEMQASVRDRLARACNTLFATQPDETITNPLCYEVFLADGLPE